MNLGQHKMKHYSKCRTTFIWLAKHLILTKWSNWLKFQPFLPYPTKSFLPVLCKHFETLVTTGYKITRHSQNCKRFSEVRMLPDFYLTLALLNRKYLSCYVEHFILTLRLLSGETKPKQNTSFNTLPKILGNYTKQQ